MSNKTQLQTNNTQLASLIQTLQGKAAGGGGGAETCTVEILSVGPTIPTTFQFIDADGAVQHVDCSSSDMLYGVELVVQGNSPLTSDMNISSNQQPEGGAVRLNPYCYYITGDATVYVGG